MLHCWILGIQDSSRTLTHVCLSTLQSIYRCFAAVDSKLYFWDKKYLYEASVDTLYTHLFT